MIILKKRKWLGEFEHGGLDQILRVPWFGHDTETTGLNPWASPGPGIFPARPFFFSFSTPEQATGWLRLPIDPLTREVAMPREAMLLLQEIYGRECDKVAHNAPFDHHQVTLSGIEIRGRELCSMIGMQIISPNEFSFKLKPLCKKYFGIESKDEDDLHDSILKARDRVRAARTKDPSSWLARWSISEDVEGDMCYGDIPLLNEYGCTDAVRVAVMRTSQIEHFQENAGQAKVYAAEMELMKTILRMEQRGIRVDEDRAKELQKFYGRFQEEHQAEIDKECPGLNVNSPKQMVKEFFGKRKYEPIRYAVKKDKSGGPVPCQECKVKGQSLGLGCKLCQGTGKNPKCDGEFLESIGIERKGDEVIIKDKLAYDVLHAKAAGTMQNYVSQYLNLAAREEGMLVLRPHFKQSEARTGRMSCEDPNLQNVASDESGKKKANIPYRTREVFIPRPGRLFHIPDYSQIEVWILALLSKDDAFIGALCSGDDAHLAVAKIIWPDGCDFDMAKADKNKAVADLTATRADNLKKYNKIRKRAKNLQFCKIYGGGPAKIASMVGCSVNEAKKFIYDYDLRLPAVPRFMGETIKIAKMQGVVTDPYGRDYPVDRGYEYRATNYLVQGTAAGVAKAAMRRVDRLLTTKWESQADLLLQVHDEFLIEVDVDVDCQALREDIVRAMSFDHKMLGCPIPFPVGYKVAIERWSVNQEVEVAA